MKTCIVIVEGAAERPVGSLNNRTPLETANCSLATGLAVTGVGGCVAVPQDDVLPRAEWWLGRWAGASEKVAGALWRGPLEAEGAGLAVPSGHWVYRGDFVTLEGDRLCSASVERLSLEEKKALVDALNQALQVHHVEGTVTDDGAVLWAGPPLSDYPGGCASPFESEGISWEEALLDQRKSSRLRAVWLAARDVLANHPVNDVRVDLRENPANGLWLWGGGSADNEPGPRSSLAPQVMVTSSLMARGLARHWDLPVVEVPPPWRMGDVEKPVSFKLSPIVESFREHDHILFYVTAPFGGGRYGSATDKVWALEALDHFLLAPLITVLDAHKPYRVVLATDGAVATDTGQCVRADIPFIVSGSGLEPDGAGHWDERTCAKGEWGTLSITTLLERIRKE